MRKMPNDIERGICRWLRRVAAGLRWFGAPIAQKIRILRILFYLYPKASIDAANTQERCDDILSGKHLSGD